MCLRTVNVPSVPSMYARSVQIATKQITLSQRRLVKKSCYMDDFVASVESVGMAKEVQKQLTEIGNKAGFHISETWSDRGHTSDRLSSRSWSGEERFSDHKGFGGSADCSGRQVFVCFQPTTWGTPITKTERAEENCNNLIWSIWTPGALYQQNCWCKRVMEALGWDEELAGPSESRLEEMVWQLDAIRVPWCLKEDRRFAMLPYTPLVVILRKPTLP